MTTETSAAPADTTQNTGTATAQAESTTLAPEASITNAAPATPIAPVEVAKPTEAPVAPVEVAKPTEAPVAPVLKAPEKYDFQGKELAGNVLEKFDGIAREFDMSQEQAIKLIDTLTPEIQAAQKAHHESQVNAWTEAAKSDKEFGGPKLQENLAIARKAIETIGSPELVKLLDDTGLGNHPEIIRTFIRAGQKISSGSFIPSGQGAAQASNPGAKLYPDMK